MRRVLRLVALACLVLGIAYMGLVNELVEVHRQLDHAQLRRQLVIYGLPLLGYCIASLGFWTAARVSEETSAVASHEVEATAP